MQILDHKRKNLGTSAWDHNVWTWNSSRSFKVLKDSDCSLVSNKNFSEVVTSNDLGPGGIKVLHLRHHSQKICTHNEKIIFECRLEDLPSLLSLWTAFSARVMLTQSQV